MKLRVFGSFVLLFLASVLLQGCFSDHSAHWHRIAFLNQPSADTLLEADHPLEHYEKEYGDYAAVFLSSEDTREHVGNLEDWEFFRTYKLRYIVLNPDEEWATTFRVTLNEEKYYLDSVYIHIVSPNGTVRQYGRESLKSEQDSDGETVYKFAYPDIEKGSIIEEGYVIAREVDGDWAQNSFEVPLQYSVPCERIHFQFIYPARWQLDFKKIKPKGSPRTESKLDKESNGKITSIMRENVPAWEDEPYSPYKAEVVEYLEFRVSEAYGGQRYIASAKSWSKETRWIRVNEDQLEDMDDDDDLIELSQKITSGKKSDFDKVDAIVSWVQENLEVGSCYRCEYDDVLDEGKGSWFMLNEIAISLMGHAGLEAEFVMLHSASDGYFDEDYISVFSQAYLPAVSVEADEEEMIVFPWIENLPAGLVPNHLQGQMGLYLRRGDIADLKETPPAKVSDNRIEEDYELTIDDEGLINVVEKKTFHGMSAYSIREALSKVKDSELEEVMEGLLTYDEGDVELKSHDIDNQKDYKKPLVITMKYSIDNLVTVTPEEVIFQTGGLFSPSSQKKYKVDTDKRLNPIRIYYDEEHIKRITINHPEEWNMQTKLKPIDYENLFGKLNASYKADNDKFVVEQTRYLKAADEPKDAIDALMKVTSRKSQLHIPTLIFSVALP